MKWSGGAWLYGAFYHAAFSGQLKRTGRASNRTLRQLWREYTRVFGRAGEIGPSRLLSSYVMAAYFIAANRTTNLTPEENYALFEAGLRGSRLFRLALGNADAYLDERRLPGRMQWSKETHQRNYENEWVVDILTKTGEYALGYNYWQCGICKLCEDEKCFPLAQYLCRLDFVLADIMGMNLQRTGTLAEGAACCDFRYSKKMAGNGPPD